MKRKRFVAITAMLLIAMLPAAICAYADAIIESGGNVNMNDNDGVDALMKAARNDNVAEAKRLIAEGADVNAKDNGGWTALMNAE